LGLTEDSLLGKDKVQTTRHQKLPWEGL